MAAKTTKAKMQTIYIDYETAGGAAIYDESGEMIVDLEKLKKDPDYLKREAIRSKLKDLDK